MKARHAPLLPAVPPCPSGALPREVFAAELWDIAARNPHIAGVVGRPEGADPAPEPPPVTAGVAPSPALGLVGLSLSGGGIRSATFNLGVLQALHDRGVLAHVDYLSTVSGGGYIGSCLSALLADGRGFPFRDAPGQPEGPALRHLRRYSNYLAPGGVMDRLALVTLLLRGLVVNFLVILPWVLWAAFAVMLLWGERIYLAQLSPDGTALLWEQGFRVTRFCFWLLLAALAVYPLLSYYTSTTARSTWFSRKLGLLGLSLLLAALLLAIAIELQPLAVYGFARLTFALGRSWLYGKLLAGAKPDTLLTLLSTVVGALVYLFSSASALRAQRGRGLAGRIALGLMWVLGPLVFWLILLTVLRRAIFLDPHALFSGEGPLGPLLGWLAGWNGWMVRVGAWLGTHAGFLRTALPELVGFFYAGWLLWLLDVAFVDVNRSSPHSFYRDRLAKAYLGTPAGRGDDEWVPPRDGLALTELAPRYAPYHLVNGTLNLPGAQHSTAQGRQADFFLFSRRYVGAPATGYCDTALMQWVHPNLTLATAMAISGAAAAPNMGTGTLRPLRMTLALLNVRLGYWLPNPRRLAGFMRHIPRAVHRVYTSVGPSYLFREMFGAFDERSGQVNVSDGGHIENLGVYELLRRRCRLIVASDAEQDATMKFGGLATAIRLARIDLGITVEMDLDALRPGADGFARRQWAVGIIHYGEQERGALIYLKSALTGTENPYVLEYHRATEGSPDSAPFPHQTTADQFFDEPQFEAYRALGHHIASAVLEHRDTVRRNPDEQARTPEEWLRELPAAPPA